MNLFGSKKTTVVNTTTVDNNIYLNNEIQNDVDVVAEFNPTFDNAVTVDTQPIADAVANAVAPIERMGLAITSAMDANAQGQAGALAALGLGLSAIGAGLGSLGEGQAKESEGLAGIAGKVESASKIAAGLLTLAALYFLFKSGRLPDIEVSAS